MKDETEIENEIPKLSGSLLEIADAAYKLGRRKVAAGNTDPELKRALATLRLQIAVAHELQKREGPHA